VGFEFSVSFSRFRGMSNREYFQRLSALRAQWAQSHPVWQFVESAFIAAAIFALCDLVFELTPLAVDRGGPMRRLVYIVTTAVIFTAAMKWFAPAIHRESKTTEPS
jgi:hypothetical protein